MEDESGDAAISIRVVTEFVNKPPQNLDRWFGILIFCISGVLTIPRVATEWTGRGARMRSGSCDGVRLKSG